MAPFWLGRVCLFLLLCLTMVSERAAGSRRRKREWIFPPMKLTENVDYTKKEFIAKIWSDKHTQGEPVEYSLTGHGADKEPVNLFLVNPQNGFVKITGILDREEISEYNLKGLARYRNRSLAEGEVQLRIQVVDQNDNPPKFNFSKGSVTESSKTGTHVMRIRADDADEAGTTNAKIAYSIVKQIPEGWGPMFSIDRDTGDIYVKNHNLDREALDSYTLIVQGVDMDGAPGGNTGMGTVEIKVLDINDNFPTLEKDEYTGNIDEGVVGVDVMKIKALDQDLENTDNWLVLFKIVKGNEDELFTIETDPKTNEGILKLVKPADYEKVKELNLALAISNVAPFMNGTPSSQDSDENLEGTGAGTDLGAGTSGQAGAGAGAGVGAGAGAGAGVGAGAGAGAGVGAGAGAGGQSVVILDPKPDTRPGLKPAKDPLTTEGKRYSVKITVNNLFNGLAFSPSVKEFPVSEDPRNIQVPKILGSFPAMNGDNRTTGNVRYAKGYDPDNWLFINEKTSEIKLIKIPDRESKFLVNGTYFAKILCLTQDVPPKTATGTIALKVQDSNDHCPKLTSTYESVCSDTKDINVTAFDEDVYPNGDPFKFVLIEQETRGEWEMVPVNGTTVSFHAKELLWPGFYELTVEIFDMQGFGCEDKQKLQVEVCTCEESDTCIMAHRAVQQHTASGKLGAPAFGLLMTGLALLMLVPMLVLFCQCGLASKFTELPFDAKDRLISYHTEGKGEDKEVPRHSAPVKRPRKPTGNSGSKVPMMLSNPVHGQTMVIDSMYGCQTKILSTEHYGSNLYSSSFRPKKHDMYGGMALPDEYLYKYFTQKARHAAENPVVKDNPLVFDFEGQDSPAGSLGCCSLLESGNDLTFLNDLGPQFMTLANICSSPIPYLPSPKVEHTIKALDATIQSESFVTTSSETTPPVVEQSKVDTKAFSSSDTLSTISTSQLVQHQRPLYYLVESHLPRSLILAESPTYLINVPAGTRGVILQDSDTEQASLNTVQQGVDLLNETSMLQETSKIDSLSSPSSPGSPVPPTVWVLGSQTCFQHHSLVSQGTGSGHPVGMENVDPGGSVQALTQDQAELQAQESTLKLSAALGISQSEEAQAQLNTKQDTSQFRLTPPLAKRQDNEEQLLKQVPTTCTADKAQNIIPTALDVMHSISPELLLVRSTSTHALAKADAIRKELEITIEGLNKSASSAKQENKSVDIIPKNDYGSAMETVDHTAKDQEEKKEAQYSKCQGSEAEEASCVSAQAMTESVLEENVSSIAQSFVDSMNDSLESGVIAGETEKINLNDTENCVIMEVTTSATTQEIISEERPVYQLEEKIEMIAPQLVREDSVTEQAETPAVELKDKLDRELADASDHQTPEDISGVVLEVDTEAGPVANLQATLLTEDVNENLQPEQQNLKEIMNHEDSHNLFNVSFNQEVISKLSLFSLYSEEDAKLACGDSKREDVEGGLQSGIELSEDTPVLEKGTVLLKDKPILEHVETVDVNIETPQDISRRTLAVDTDLVTDEEKELLKPEHQDVNEDGCNQVNESVTVEERNLTVAQETPPEQSLFTVHPEEEFEWIDSMLERDVGEQLPSSIQTAENDLVMERLEINDELDQKLVETNSNQQQPANIQQSVLAEPKSDNETDLDELTSDSSESYLSISLEHVLEAQQYVDTSELDTVEEFQGQFTTDQTILQGTMHCNIQHESLAFRESSELENTTEEHFKKESAGKVSEWQTLRAELVVCEDVDSSEDTVGMQVEMETEGVAGLEVTVLTDEETEALNPRQEQTEDVMENIDQDEVNALRCQTWDSEEDEDLSEHERYEEEQNVDSSAAQANSEITLNTVENVSGYTEEAYVSSGIQYITQVFKEEAGECRCSGKDLEESADPTQSADPSKNKKTEQGWLEHDDKEIQQTLPQTEEAVTDDPKALTLLSLSEEGPSKISEGHSQEQDALGEKAADMFSEVMEQVLATARSTSSSGTADFQGKSDQETTLTPKNKHRNSKTSSKKGISPKSPVGKCKSQ